MPKLTVTTPQLAELLGISRQRVNELCRQGKIPRESSGRWNPERVLEALDRNMHPGQRRAASLPTAAEAEAWRKLIDRVFAESHRLPAFAAALWAEFQKLGVGPAEVLAFLPNVFTYALFELAGGEVINAAYPDESDLPDLPAVDMAFDESLTEPMCQAALRVPI